MFWSYSRFTYLASRCILDTFPTSFTNKAANANYVFFSWNMQILQCAWCSLQYHKRCYRRKWYYVCFYGQDVELRISLQRNPTCYLLHMDNKLLSQEPRHRGLWYNFYLHGWIAGLRWMAMQEHLNSRCVQPRPSRCLGLQKIRSRPRSALLLTSCLSCINLVAALPW